MKLEGRCGNLSRLMTLFTILLCIMDCSSARMKCRKNSRCTTVDQESCCQAINQQDGVCRPKISLGKRCQPAIRMVFLSNDGFAFSSCGCAHGLTCTKVLKKRKNRRKNKKKAYKIRYKCLPIPTETREISERNFNSS